LELALLESGERSGRLEQVFKYLARYFHDLQEARSEVVRRSVYPVFLLHFAVFILPIANLVKGGFSTENIIRYLFQVLGTLFLFYGLAILLITIVIGLLQISRSVAGSDALTRIIPLIGKVRTFASVSRFCMALEMQIQAGVPMLQALPVAGRASQSGLILNRAERAVAKIDAGSTLADALGAPGPLPANVLRGLRLGQEAGTLDEELSRWGQFYLDQALTRIRVLADWLPKIIYFLIIGYVAYRIITTFAGTMQDMSKMIESAG
jgi:type IV pilus assembly protein PilC